jgi:hypothetical protein
LKKDSKEIKEKVMAIEEHEAILGAVAMLAGGQTVDVRPANGPTALKLVAG